MRNVISINKIILVDEKHWVLNDLDVRLETNWSV